MKSSSIIRFFLLAVTCSLSFFSYRYLQNIRAQQPAAQSELTSNAVRNMSPDSNSASGASASPTDNQEDPSTLPDVELLKFVIQKSREGIPVLNIDRWIPSW